MIFIVVIFLQAVVTTRTLCAFPGDPLSSIRVNLAAKIFILSLGCHPPPWMVSPGAVPRPALPPSNATAAGVHLYSVMSF